MDASARDARGVWVAVTAMCAGFGSLASVELAGVVSVAQPPALGVALASIAVAVPLVIAIVGLARIFGSTGARGGAAPT